jgi:hypothetical protein
MAWAGVRHLVAMGVLVAACSSQDPPAPAGGAGGGASGGGMGAVAGHPNQDQSCIDGTDACVGSCSQSPAEATTSPGFGAYCDATGAFACNDGLKKRSSCPPDSCARMTANCCNEAHTTAEYATCSADGVPQACPAGSHLITEEVGCISPGVDVTNCAALQGQVCDFRGNQCTSRTSTTMTACGCITLATGATVWSCDTRTAH